MPPGSKDHDGAHFERNALPLAIMMMRGNRFAADGAEARG
jgi:hypothetical protein